MPTYLFRRLLVLIPVLIGVSVVVFLSIRFIPGDPAEILAGEFATKDFLEVVRKEFGLDRPLYEQYVRYMWNLLHGNLGYSMKTNLPVGQEIASRLPATLELAVSSMVIAALLGVAAGVISATRARSWFDYCSMLAALFGLSVPVFFLGLILILVFSVHLHLLPFGGRGSVLHLLLPSIALGATAAGMVARLTRAAMLDVLRSDYIQTARGKGLSEAVVQTRHALKNALIPVITILGLQAGELLGGAVITESVFAWPGLGRLIVDAVKARDYPLVQGSLISFALMFAAVNLCVDLLYALLNPRIRYR